MTSARGAGEKANGGYAALTLLLIAIAVFQFLTIRSGHVWGDDFAQYILHARNIARRTTYAGIGYLYNPDQPLGPEIYPPLTSLLLAPLYSAFGLSLFPMKCLMVICLAGFAGFVYSSMRYFIPHAQALLIAALVGFNPFLWDFKNNIGSDLLFAALCYATLTVVQGAFHAAGSKYTAHVGWSIAAGVLMYATYAARTVGIIFLPMLAIWEILRFRRLSPVSAIAPGVASSLIAGQRLFLGPSKGYLNEIHAFFSWKTPLQNIQIYVRSLLAFLVNGYSLTAAKVLFVIVLGFALVGLILTLRKGMGALELFGILYAAPVLMYPLAQGARYMVPLFPLLLYYAMVSVSKVWSSASRPQRYSGVALAVLVGVSYAGFYTRADYGPIRSGIGEPDFASLCEYIRSKTMPDARFLFRKARVLSLFTGRAAGAYSPIAGDADNWNFLRRNNIGYVVINRHAEEDFATDRTVLQPMLSRSAACVTAVFENATFELYSVAPSCR